MFDFEYDNKWDVDKTADSLNTSLFGKSKKQNAKAANSPKKNQNELHTSVIHDSDDEKYSRKGKKKLKERRRKKNKQSGNAKSEGTEENTSSLSHDKDRTSPKVFEKDKKTKQKNKKQKIDATQSSKVDKIVPGKTETQLKKQKKKMKDGRNAGEEEINLAVKKKDRKRKRTMSEDAEADGANSKSKRAKLDGNLNESTVNENVDTVKKKRKRNRKKKNNSKKNKYKHLALNSNKTKESSDLRAKNNEDIPQVSDQSKLSQIELNGKEKNKITKKAVGDSKQEKDKSRSPIQQREKTSKKRKRKDETSLKSISDAANSNNSSVNPSGAAPSTKKRKQIKKSDVQESTVGNKSNDVITNGHEERKSVGKKKKLTNKKPAVSTLPSGQSTSFSDVGHVNAQQSKLSKAAKLKQQKLARMLGQSDSLDPKAVQSTNSSPNKSKKKTKLKGNDPTASEAQIKQQLSPVLKSLKEEKNDAWTPKNSTSPFAKPKDSPLFSSLWGKGAEMGLQAKEKLDSARFRYVNEQLYSCQGSEAWQMFREDPDAFQVYHQGFENQVHKWSVNPLNVIIKQMKDKSPKLVVADFGCGDAKLAESIPQKVHSFDLVALNNRVTVCDISKTPLPSESVDIGVFCLSLMGTNISDYIHEANRVLKTGGLLKIAEVVSRFSGVSGFIAGVCKHGFQLLNKRDLSDMFYLMDFRKLKPVKKSASLGEIKLKPCIYKKR